MDPSDRNYREIGHPRPRIARADLDRDIAAIKANLLMRMSSLTTQG
jgi:hypothetical protein